MCTTLNVTTHEIIYELRSLRSMHATVFGGGGRVIFGSQKTRKAESPRGGKRARRITRLAENPRTEKIVKTVCWISLCSLIIQSTGGLENLIGLIINHYL